MEEDEKLGQEKGVSFQKPRPIPNYRTKTKIGIQISAMTSPATYEKQHLFSNTTHSCLDVGLNSTGQTSVYYTRVTNHDIPEKFPDFMHIWRTSDLYPRSIAQCSNSNSRLKNSVEKNSGRCEKKSKQRYHKKVSFFYESCGFLKQWLGFSMPFHACNHRKNRHLKLKTSASWTGWRREVRTAIFIDPISTGNSKNVSYF